MERHEKIIGIIFLVATMLLFWWSMGSIIEANAHESHGFTHMKGNSGSIIGQRYCDDGTSLWYQDLDEDGELDTCTRVIFIHDKIHIRRSNPIDNDCSCIIEEDI